MSVSSRSDQTLVARPRPPNRKDLSPAAAHEINNPLDALLNLLYLIESDATMSEKSHHYLRLAQEEVRRIAEIAHDTLNQNRPDTLLEPASVGKLLGDVLDFYEQQFVSSGITLQRRYSSNGDIPIHEGLLREVFSNLLLNAQAAMPKGGNLHARVFATHEWSGQGRRGVRVTVADNGSGIPSNMLSRVFQPFFTTKTSGNGMGLSLVKDIVHKHHGWLRVRSSTKPGHCGTIFSIFLPAQA